jgi:hypothetical protein
MKKYIFAILIVLLLVLSGCKGRGPRTNEINEVYHIGTKGVEINFINNAPPEKVYEGDRIDLSVEVRNAGSYPEGRTFKGKIELSGFDPASISGSWDGGNTIPTDFEGRTQYNPEGGYTVMTYKDNDGVHVPFDADFYEPNILLHTCYEYKTIADPIVCIDPDPYDIVEEQKVCNIGDTTLSGGQGAPIAVTKIEEEVGSDRIYFRIYIANQGEGTVMLPRAYSDCPFDVEFEELDKVVADIKLPYDASPDCSPKGTASDPIRLTDGKGYIFCKFSKPAEESAYTTSLNIELEYVYSSSISKSLKIVNLK